MREEVFGHEELLIIHGCMNEIRELDHIDESDLDLPFNKLHLKIMGALIESYKQQRRENGGLP